MKIAIGSDHAGFDFKQRVKDILIGQGLEVVDFGADSLDSVDYPDFAHPVANAVENGDVKLGILVCGSGNGVCMTANKHQGVRAALSWNSEHTAMARLHNDANILCIPARFIEFSEVEKMVDAFLNTDFEGGRHERRVNKIPE